MARPVTGLEAVDKALAKLDGKMQRKFARTATRKSAGPMLKDARKRAPRKGSGKGATGFLRRSLRLKGKAYKGVFIVIIGARSEAQQTRPDGRIGKPVKYAHLVEFGTRTQAARPFMRPAWDAHKHRIVPTMTRLIYSQIETNR